MISVLTLISVLSLIKSDNSCLFTCIHQNVYSLMASTNNVYLCMYADSMSEYNILNLSFPILTYSNADTLKSSILNDNRDRTGIYRWTQIPSGKNYIGYAIDLHKRLKNYYNIYYLEKQLKTIIVWYIGVFFFLSIVILILV